MWKYSNNDSFGPANFKAYTEDLELSKVLRKIDGCKYSNKYVHPDGEIGWDFLVDKRAYNRVAKVLNFKGKPVE